MCLSIFLYCCPSSTTSEDSAAFVAAATATYSMLRVSVASTRLSYLLGSKQGENLPLSGAL